MAAPSNKRHFSRIPMDGTARLSCSGGDVDTQLIDISLKGALIARPGNWTGSVGDRCHLQLILPDSSITITMEAVVAHAHDNVIGVRCEQIDLASISHLRRLVELNLGNEDVLERELGELVEHTA